MSQTDSDKRWAIRIEIARLKHRQYSLFFKYSLAFFAALIFVSLFGSFSFLNTSGASDFQHLPYQLGRESLLTLGVGGALFVVSLFWYLFSQIYTNLGIVEDWEEYPMINVPKIERELQKIMDKAQQMKIEPQSKTGKKEPKKKG